MTFTEFPLQRHTAVAGQRRSRKRRFLTQLDRPGDAFANIGPNWFASVMGTGIVANAAVLLPVSIVGLQTAALIVWIAAGALLILISMATAVHWLRYRETARSHASTHRWHRSTGRRRWRCSPSAPERCWWVVVFIGLHAAVVVDSVLWGLGTATGLFVAAAIPYLMFTRHRLDQSMTLGSWLMPVVPPMVSAATGAALISHLAAGQAQRMLLLGCYAMFGLSLVASLVIITLLWARLAYNGPGPAETVPTLWIVLGPLGQSITAANLLASQSSHVMTGIYAPTFRALGVVYGMPVWGFAMLWLAVAAAITIKRPVASSIHAHLVEFHVPCRDGRHRHVRARAAHGSDGPDRCRGRAVRAAGAGMAGRRHQHHSAASWRGGSSALLSPSRPLSEPSHAEPRAATAASSHRQKRAAGPSSRGLVLRTARKLRCNSTPATGRATSVPVASSSSMVRWKAARSRPPSPRA